MVTQQSHQADKKKLDGRNQSTREGRGGDGRRAPGRQAVVRMGDAVEALALEEVIQPAEVKQNHGGRLRIHPSRLPVTIFALSVFVFVVIRVWLGRRRPCRRRGKRRAGGRLQLQLLH